MSEMNDRPRHDELDRLLRNQDEAGRGELAQVLRAIRDGLEEPPSPEVAERHLAAIVAAAGEASHAAPAVAPPDRTTARPWGLRVRRVLGLTAAKVAIGVGAAAAATGTGLAATGNLPDPAQQVISDVAERVGISIPEPAPPVPAPLPADEGDRPADPPRPSGVPSDQRDDARPDEADTGRPSDAPDRPADRPGQPADDEVPGKAPAEHPGNTPSETPRRAPADTRGDAPEEPADGGRPNAQDDADHPAPVTDRSTDATAVPPTEAPARQIAESEEPTDDRGRSTLAPPSSDDDG